MPQSRYQQLLLERLHSTTRWETAPANLTLADLDATEIKRTLQRAIEINRLTRAAEATEDLREILTRLGLMKEGQLLQAAAVLFGVRLLPDYPQCHLRLARFRGTTKTAFLDQRQLEGHAFALLDEAMLFLSRHLPVAGRIEPGVLERIDEPLFPPVALREALVNALCHRDYSQAGGAVSVAIYDDRLEVWSDGRLPGGIQVEDLKRDHESRPRNPLIAGVFYQRGLVERWGRGTQTIVELCVQAGHPEPEFVERASSVGVRFIPSRYVPPTVATHPLTQRQRQILSLLAQTSELPVRGLLARLDEAPAARTLREDLARLRELGLVQSLGKARGTVWQLVHNPAESGGNPAESGGNPAESGGL